MGTESGRQSSSQTFLTDPIYLRLDAAQFAQAILSIREHLPPQESSRADGPLVLLTFHPGYLTGSYRDRDYFERVVSLLFQQAQSRYRLRTFTINHPGYDQPDGTVINRFNLEPYSIHNQPLAMQAALSWLFAEQLAEEKEIVWVAYGHSMGGLALSRYQPHELMARWVRNGRSLRLIKVLSAPALFLHPQAQAAIGRLDLLHLVKQTVGRLPFYAPVATGLYHLFAPLFFRRDADKYSINGLREFCDFRQVDPFLLLEQGRELIRFGATAVDTPELLANTHVILPQQDGMIDLTATQALIDVARQQGHTVTQHNVDSTHLLELDAAEAVVQVLETVLRQAGI